VDIPVKPYKHHRVFGYSPKTGPDVFEGKRCPSEAQALKAETSRLAELRKLKAATLGNSIATTAEYYGKWVPAEEKAKKEVVKKDTPESTAEDAPLFSGTTYEAKYKDILLESKSSKQDWLDREGFGTKQAPLANAASKGDASTHEREREDSHAKLEPSLDRLETLHQTSRKLEPTLDRLAPSSKERRQTRSSQKPSSEAQELPSEDLDLLRASDIRALTKTSRQSKQDNEIKKQDKRHKLENNFAAHQRDDDGRSITFPYTILESSKKLSESLNHLWHRVRAQQKAWLAEATESLDSKNDSTSEEAPRSINQERQASGSETKAASSVKRAVTRPIQTFTPSQEVLDAEQESWDRTFALRKARLEATKVEAEVEDKQKALADTIKATYEDEYGPIRINPLQIQGLAHIDRLAEAIKVSNTRADRNAVRTMIARCEAALRYAKQTRMEALQKLKAIQSRLGALKPISTPPSRRMASDLQSNELVMEEKPAFQSFANVSDVEVDQASSTSAKASLSISAEASSTTAPSLYKVLAYDSSTLQMNIAETTSSMSATGDAETQPLHPTEVLSRLNNVAKFLPYFADMEKQGYEMVSGSGDVLVFKRIRAPMDSPEATTKPGHAIMEDLPDKSTPADSVAESTAPNTDSSKIRRQEDVFSGSGQTWHQEDGGSGSSSNQSTEPGWFRKAAKRVFFASTLTAAIAYTLGVVAEQAGAQVPGDRPKRSGRPGIYSTEDSR
jgi:hypothetical protein